MFLEQYLDLPIEQQIAAISKRPVDRCSLIEVGNLVVTDNRYGPSLLLILARSLVDAGYEWMVFTVTEQMERLMRCLGFAPHPLISADPNRLTSDKTSWGSYYANNPRVMVGSLAVAAQIIKNTPSSQEITQRHEQQIREIAYSLCDYRRLAGE